MSTTPTGRLADIVGRHQDELLSEWAKAQRSATSHRTDVVTDADLARESAELLSLLQRALANGDVGNIDGPGWEAVRDFLGSLTRSRA